jgi:hypothetical protein
MFLSEFLSGKPRGVKPAFETGIGTAAEAKMNRPTCETTLSQIRKSIVVSGNYSATNFSTRDFSERLR